MIERRRTDVAVVGGGPAGIAAALAVASTGARVELIDAFPEAGGQYWMQPPESVHRRGAQVREGANRVAALRHAGIPLHGGAEVWGVVDRFRVLARRRQAERDLEVASDVLVLCTGAHDRVFPFPGWTLPGVMTAGAGQRFAKMSGVSPGRRVVVAGTGAFLWAVAGSILKVGGKIAALIDANPRPGALARHLMRHPERWNEAARLILPVLAAGVPLRFGQAVVAAEGEGRVAAVRTRALRSGTERRIEGVDTLLVGHGFRPSIELSALLRCRHVYDERCGGWYCEADPSTGATSVDNIFVAGEVAGFAGAVPGWLRGQLAGLAAAERLGFSAPDATRRELLRRRLARAQAFADALNELSLPPPQLVGLANADTVVCRCEEVTLGDLQAAFADGADSVYAAKLWSRAGMGRCQGRICGDTIARLGAEASGADIASMGFNRPRLPIRPVAVSRVAAGMDNKN